MRYIVQLTGTQVKYGDDADIFQFQLWENSSNTRTVEDSIVDLTGSVVTVDIANGSGFVGRFVTTTIPEKGIVNIDMSNEVIAKLPADTYYFQVEVVNGDKKKIFPTDGGDIIKIFKSLTETQGELVPRTTIDDVLNKVDEKIAEYTSTIAKGDKGDKGEKGDMDLSQITVGGRNILLGTGNSFTGVGDNSTNGTFNAQGGQYYLAGGKKVSDLYKQYGSSGYLTLSFDWTASGSTISGQFSPVWNNTPWGGLSISGGIQPSITNTSGYYKATVSLKANGYSTGIATGIQFRQDNLQGNVTISNVKLEAGNVATDWSPAPEDTIATANSLTTRPATFTDFNTVAKDVLSYTGNWQITSSAGITNGPYGNVTRGAFVVIQTSGWSDSGSILFYDLTGPKDVYVGIVAGGVLVWTKVAKDSNVVHNAGNETVAGDKTFTGTLVANNPIKAKLSIDMLPQKDLNSATATGQYKIDVTYSNAPSQMPNGAFIDVLNFDDNLIYQVIVARDISDAGHKSTMWVRIRLGGNWGNWQSISKDDNVVHNTGNEIVSGDKTFTGNTTLATTTILAGNYGLRVTPSGFQKTTDGKTWVSANI